MNSPDMVVDVYSDSDYLVPHYQAEDVDIQKEFANIKQIVCFESESRIGREVYAGT